MFRPPTAPFVERVRMLLRSVTEYERLPCYV